MQEKLIVSLLLFLKLRSFKLRTYVCIYPKWALGTCKPRDKFSGGLTRPWNWLLYHILTTALELRRLRLVGQA